MTSRSPAEKVARFADVRDVVRHFPDTRRRGIDRRFDVEFFRDQLGRSEQRVAFAERQVDRLVACVPSTERFHAARNPVNAVVHVGEVEHLVPAEDRDSIAAQHEMREEREHAHHPMKVVVESAVDVGETEDEIRKS